MLYRVPSTTDLCASVYCCPMRGKGRSSCRLNGACLCTQACLSDTWQAVCTGHCWVRMISGPPSNVLLVWLCEALWKACPHAACVLRMIGYGSHALHSTAHRPQRPDLTGQVADCTQLHLRWPLPQPWLIRCHSHASCACSGLSLACNNCCLTNSNSHFVQAPDARSHMHKHACMSACVLGRSLRCVQSSCHCRLTVRLPHVCTYLLTIVHVHMWHAPFAVSQLVL